MTKDQKDNQGKDTVIDAITGLRVQDLGPEAGAEKILDILIKAKGLALDETTKRQLEESIADDIRSRRELAEERLQELIRELEDN